jgi:hypothetical protein
MTKLSKEELKERMTNLKAKARAEVSKTEVMHFRVDPQNIEQLYVIAGQKKKPVGAMVREWVLERIQLELSSTKSQQPISLTDMNSRLEAVERQLHLR